MAMQLRAGVILSLTILGILFLLSALTTPVERRTGAGLACFLLAGVYALVTRPRGGIR